MNITIFYSWQSDTPFNNKEIRVALREAMNAIESELPGAVLKLDEATSNQVGTHHIPSSILNNITESDIFVGDLSVVGQSTHGAKKLANPNVLIELGYAISQLGWNRIIILFNKHLGTFADLPFDIEKRSCLDFSIKQTGDKSGIGQLRTELIPRLIDIITKNPEKPSNRAEPIDRDRANNIKQINSVLALLIITDLDKFFKNGDSRISIKMVNGIKQLKLLTSSTSFYLTDKKLKKRLIDFENTWTDIFGYISTNFSKDADFYLSNLSSTGRQGTLKRLIRMDVEKVEKSLDSMVKYIRLNYPEIHI